MDNYGNTALILAASKGHIEVVKRLLKKDADVDFKNNLRCTAFHLASKNGRIEVVKLLIREGANDVINSCGCTALHTAANNGHNEIAKIILDSKPHSETLFTPRTRKVLLPFPPNGQSYQS